MKCKVRSTKAVDAVRVVTLLSPQKSDLPLADWILSALKAGTMRIEAQSCVTVSGNMDAREDDAIVCLPDGKIVVLNAEAFVAIYEPTGK